MPVFTLPEEYVFPPPHLATREGLLAVGGDLNPGRILAAYRQGIFPWYSQGDPILWWSPDPRMVLYPHEFRPSKSLKRTIRRTIYQVSFDTAFDQVIHNCGRLRTKNGEGTWITPEMEAAYKKLHMLGYAHSVEAWHDGQLVGGLYGIAIGHIFFGESMFSTMNDASKVCLYHLNAFLLIKKFSLIDCQVPSEHLRSLGGVFIGRGEFLEQLQKLIKFPTHSGSWTDTGAIEMAKSG